MFSDMQNCKVGKKTTETTRKPMTVLNDLAVVTTGTSEFNPGLRITSFPTGWDCVAVSACSNNLARLFVCVSEWKFLKLLRSKTLHFTKDVWLLKLWRGDKLLPQWERTAVNGYTQNNLHLHEVRYRAAVCPCALFMKHTCAYVIK